MKCVANVYRFWTSFYLCWRKIFSVITRKIYKIPLNKISIFKWVIYKITFNFVRSYARCISWNAHALFFPGSFQGFTKVFLIIWPRNFSLIALLLRAIKVKKLEKIIEVVLLFLKETQGLQKVAADKFRTIGSHSFWPGWH